MGMGRRTKRCTEMACGGSCVHPMRGGFERITCDWAAATTGYPGARRLRWGWEDGTEAVYRDGVWWILRSSNGGGIGIGWGGATARIYRSSNRIWTSGPDTREE